MAMDNTNAQTRDIQGGAVSRRMDAHSIREQLGKNADVDVDEKELRRAMREMSDRARQRVAFNFSGALPGPPAPAPTFLQRMSRWVNSLKGS